MDDNIGGGEAHWRSELQPDSRRRITNKIKETLLRHLPLTNEDEGLQELENIALRFEDRIFNTATSLSDYLRNISLKMLALETVATSLQLDAGSVAVHLEDPGLVQIPSVSNQPQHLSPNVQDNIGSTGVANSASKSPRLETGMANLHLSEADDVEK